jgi:anti-anti-sigma factor
MEGFQIGTVRVGADTVVTVSGELDLASADQLWQELEPHLGRAGTVVLDCTALTFLDSTGLRVLLRAAQQAAANGGRFRAAAMNPDVARVLEITGLTETIDTRRDVSSALAD